MDDILWLDFPRNADPAHFPDENRGSHLEHMVLLSHEDIDSRDVASLHDGRVIGIDVLFILGQKVLKLLHVLVFRRQRIALPVKPHRPRVRSLAVADHVLHLRGLLRVHFELRLIVAVFVDGTLLLLPKGVLRLDLRSFERRDLGHDFGVGLVLKDGNSLRLIFVGNFEEARKFLHRDFFSGLKVFVDVLNDDSSDVLA